MPVQKKKKKNGKERKKKKKKKKKKEKKRNVSIYYFFPLFTMEQFAPRELCSIKLKWKRDKKILNERTMKIQRRSLT